ncbi:MCE family protein [Nocardia goodfellowii]|uniref:Phospholipid/cholesterol/gamma-HCH transport system substrate-binding protein n=1 Tax=Nocardia goodfellowii TaxID=882446 RepID=A0ABS4QML0_9NOCA|nr:MlaD family protein [Nocardia goodfellowii]MBP2192944.1 phospholipid/cholesterol/gamma-HCH transport system substrate-binding protein [Nocardia goodfellowii]
MSYRRSLLVLIVFLVVSVVLTWTVIVTLERGISGATHRYSAMFTDVSGLRVGDDVRMAGVRVGRVDSIQLSGALARVGFEVQDDQVITGNTTASVTYQNLIGQRYLGLAMGNHNDPAALKPGAEIPVGHTEPSFDISKLLNGFEPLFGTLDHAAIDNITDALIKALQGDNGAITTLIAETTRLAEAFAGPDEVLGRVITNLANITGSLAAQSGNLTTVIEQTRTLFEGLARNRQVLFDSVDRISVVVARASQILAADMPTLTNFLNRNPGYSQHFLDNRHKFENLGFNLPLVLKGMARMTQEGAYVDAYLCNISVSLVPGLTPMIPEIVDAVTPGGSAQHTSKCR